MQSAPGAANEAWFQRLIAAGLKMGISKRELLEDYYPGELAVVFAQYAALGEPEPEESYADELW